MRTAGNLIMKRHLIRSRLFAAFALLALGLVAGCSPGAGAGPSTWIDRPLDGDQVAMEPLTIEAHASDVNGVSRLEFFVDSASIGAVPTDGTRFVEGKAGWSPTAPGIHTIRIEGVDAEGNRGASATARIVVTGLTATLVPPPTSVVATAQPATETLEPATEIPSTVVETDTPIPTTVEIATLPPPLVASEVPTLTPWPTYTATAIPTAAPVCPGAPGIANFTAQPATITAGQSTTLQWGFVTNATNVQIDPDIGGVPTPGSVSVSPNQTTTYTLTATGCGGAARKQVKVVVKAPVPPTARPTTPPTIPPPDTTPPTISGLGANPAKIWVSGCSGKPQSTTLNAQVSDPDGVQSVVVSWSLGGQSGQIGMGPAGGNLYQASIGGFNIFGTLSFNVSATDSNNNSSQAGPASVTVAPCIQ